MILKRLLSVGLVGLLLHVSNTMPVAVSALAGQGGASVVKVKAEVAKRVGKKSRVTLQDGSKLKGSISQAGDDSFTLTDGKTGQARTLAYSDVSRVRGQGGLSIAAKIGIGVGIAVGALGLAYAVGCGNDPFC
jgi:hypothetical protein